ncbi:MAG: hypothetical protein K0Q55_1765 [Verrucomicrobia bacterium]|jgi:hypothetical protein|nr:hypothetical protein [Verrucomicrobiota bacterium]
MQAQGTPLLTRLNSTLDDRLPLPRLLKLAFLCGVLPLVTGTLVFLTWLVTRWDWLMLAGLITIFLGLVWFVMGAICLSIHLHRRGQIAPPERRRQNWLAFTTAGLLLVNFPAAYYYTAWASGISTRYTLIVVNESGQHMESVMVSAPGVKREFGPIQAGGQVKRHLNFFGDGRMDFKAKASTETAGMIDGYAMGSMGGKKVVRLKPDGAYTVDDAE